MIIGQDDGPLQLVNGSIYVFYRAYFSRNNLQVSLRSSLYDSQLVLLGFLKVTCSD
jgi:hypothetical protein